jgi:hypothetical protein
LKNKEIQSSLNAEFEKRAVDFKNEIEKQAKENYELSEQQEYPFRTYEAFVEYKVTFNKNNLLSIPVTYYSFTGGAHGMTIMEPNNIYLKTGKKLLLGDLFKPGYDYKTVIAGEVAKAIHADPATYFEDAIKTVQNFKDNQPFYLEDGNIVIYYGLYEIAPYASGIKEFKLPVSLFKNNLRPEYLYK